MFEGFPHRPDVCEFPFVVVHPPVCTEFTVDMGLLRFLKQQLRLAFEQPDAFNAARFLRIPAASNNHRPISKSFTKECFSPQNLKARPL